MLGVIFLKQTITSVYIYILSIPFCLFTFYIFRQYSSEKIFLKEEFNYNKHLIMH